MCYLDDQISSWTFDKYRYRYEIRKLRSRVTISHSWKSLVGKLDGTIRVPWESSRSRYTDLLLLNNSALTSTTCLSTLPFAHRCFSPSAIRRISGWKQGKEGIDGKTLVLSTRESNNRCTRNVFENFSFLNIIIFQRSLSPFRPIRIIFLLFSGKKEDISVNRKWKGSLNIFLVCVKMFLNI